MKRILIVDDEPIIVNSIFRMLEETSHLDLEAYRAYNVYEALDHLKQTRIDVVISDIRMPGMSGIELHKQIIESWPRCKVIFLTGYNEFEYARHAIRTGGVVDYVLKNEDDHAIVSALEKAFAEMEKAEDGAVHMLRARKKLQLALPALQRNTLFDLMRDPSSSSKEVEKRFEESEILLNPDKKVFLVLGRVDEWMEGASEADRTLFLGACQNIAEEYLAPTVESVSVTFESGKLAWFMQPKSYAGKGEFDEVGEEERWAYEHMKTRVYGILEAVQQTCKQLLKLSISFVMAREPSEWSQAGAQFYFLKALLGQSSYNGQELLIQDSNQLGLRSASDRDIPFSESQHNKKQFELLEQYLAGGKRDSFHRLYGEIANQVALPEYPYRLETFHILSLNLISYAIRVGLFHELFMKMDLGKTTQYDAHECWEEAVAYLAAVADYLLDYREPAPEEQSERLIATIHNYVQAHLGGDLSLTRLSMVVHHSPTYLSRIYKRMTGRMLSDYITEERMNKARDLLAQSDLKIQEIATRVGYEAAPQFNRSFKKTFKMTPQEYRDLSYRINDE
ncbi:response regulator [Cohnella sp. LGH]|uniref:response regulator n=1 Tax=Cohnella sp. LGH TaxID=1619153 RepID=UPI001ADCA08E|nr:response regulator [Cohnella sp. LGH]QTH43600.1 response regulator [Cohnella sp. LGH]